MIFREKVYNDYARKIQNNTITIQELLNQLSLYNQATNSKQRASIRANMGIKVFKSFQEVILPSYDMFEYTDHYYPIDAYIVDTNTNTNIGVEIKNRDEHYIDEVRYPDLRFECLKCEEFASHNWQNLHFKTYILFNFMIIGGTIRAYLFNIKDIMENVRPQAQRTLNKKRTCEVNGENVYKWTYPLDKHWATVYEFNGKEWNTLRKCDYTYKPR